MVAHKLTIQGMSCGHCVMHVRTELSKIAVVKDVQIGSAEVEVDEAKVAAEDLRSAVATAGYTVVDIS